MQYMAGALNRLLVADGESGVCNFLSPVAERLGFKVRTVATKVDFSAQLESFQPVAIVLDLNLPGTSGTELLRHLAELSSPAQIFLISGDDIDTLQAAEHLGVLHGLRMAGVMRKPLLLNDVESTLGKLLSEPAPVEVPVDDGQTGLFQLFDAEEFERAQKALAAAEAAYIAALEIGRTILGPDDSDFSSSGRHRISGTGG
jgi:CheY-like chemotaxis protein